MIFEKALELMRQGELLSCKEFKAVYKLNKDCFEFSYLNNFGKWQISSYFSRYLILSDTWEIFKLE